MCVPSAMGTWVPGVKFYLFVLKYFFGNKKYKYKIYLI